ncbi:MAG: hypothetical protein KBS77_07550 [Bacteroidales bacterium]|nr:hypothetical protein [Candidatus Colicola faecequi]
MQKQLKYIIRQSAAAVMLLLFVGYYADVNFFSHAHIINGVTLVHSHVHNEHHHDTQGGGHSTSEITLIAHMASQFLATGETAANDLSTDNLLLQTIGIEQNAKATPHHLTSLSLRAPPAIL